MQSKPIKTVVILGGGAAGWLTAGVIASEHCANSAQGVSVKVIESPEVSTIGVGEGTWPSMRGTLAKIGISETDLFKECDASFKQGAKFAKWKTGKDDDFYYHPLVLPNGSNEVDLVRAWKRRSDGVSFSNAVCHQEALCENGLAPKQIQTPEYAHVANYAYHLDSTKLGLFLRKHCVEKLGVEYIADHVVDVLSEDDGSIQALATKVSGHVLGDLFVDCSGMTSLLLGKHFGIPLVSKKHVLFNDAAIATHVPYLDELDPIASHTISTAQSSGWIWDIGLPTRKGVGAVFSSSHINDDNAQQELQNHIAHSVGSELAASLSYRKISFNPGHRELFWYKNCVAVGMSAGFIEPLEASALVLVESAAGMISAELPANTAVMNLVAKRYNKRFSYYWETIIDFLKLHYVLSERRDSEYWRDNVHTDSMPEKLKEMLDLWKYHVPNRFDFPLAEEMFPAASWQYVLYGMGFETVDRETELKMVDENRYSHLYMENQKFISKCLSALPTNRDLINKIREYGMTKV